MPEQKLNILIVDDHEDTVMMFHARLTREGHEAIGLTDLARVDDALSKHPVDVLLIDLLFSGRDATSDIRRIRLAFARLPIIVMSGTADLQLTLRAIEAGANSYLTKPVDWDILRGLLQNVRAT